jgi:hypothetical protein
MPRTPRARLNTTTPTKKVVELSVLNSVLHRSAEWDASTVFAGLSNGLLAAWIHGKAYPQSEQEGRSPMDIDHLLCNVKIIHALF